MKHVHLLPNVITAFGLSCGLFVIFKMTMIETGTVDYSTLLATTGILLLASLADLLDGAVARAMKAESDFGGLFDSLSDAITFGVCPTVIVLKSLSVTPKTELSFFLTAAAMIFAVSGVLRLARFNVLAKRALNDPDLMKAQKMHFTGMPIPAAAAACVSLNLLIHSEEFHSLIGISPKSQVIVSIVMLVMLGYFMVSRWKFPSLKNLHIRVASFRILFLTVISAVLLFYGLISHFAIVFFICAWGYITVAAVLAIFRVIAGRKSKTLEEFEPEEFEPKEFDPGHEDDLEI
jgi:CDP-diacylglycerol--serine O-phosphatidyltransferase